MRIRWSLFFIIAFLFLCQPVGAITSEQIDALLTPLPQEAEGFIMKNDEYELELKEISQESSEDISEYKPLLTKNQQLELEKKGYTLFYQDDSESSISIKTDLLSFAPQSGKKITTLTTQTSVRNKNQTLYRIGMIADGPLSSETNNTIPSTSCDSERKSCSSGNPAIWERDTNYGWGFSVNSSEAFQPLDTKKVSWILSNQLKKAYSSFTLLFKIITSPDTPDSIYRTSVRIILLPW